MLTRCFAIAVAAACRALPALGLASVLSLVALGPPAPAHAEPLRQQGYPDNPVARLQIIIHSVHIYDDRDLLGEGEIYLVGQVVRCTPPSCSNVYQGNGELLVDYRYGFNASTGDTVPFGRLIPRDGDTINSLAVSPEGGIGVFPGERYVLYFGAMEQDTVSGDFMGSIVADIDEAHNWGLGVHTARSLVGDQSDPQHSFGGPRPGDFEVTWEIRRTPLPDLVPTAIETPDNSQVCVRVANTGPRDAGAFQVTVRIDDVVAAPYGNINVGGLAAGETTRPCIHAQLPTGGQHLLRATVDEAHAVLEQNEANNQIVQGYAGRVASGSGAPTGPSAVAADPGSAPPSPTPTSRPPTATPTRRP